MFFVLLLLSFFIIGPLGAIARIAAFFGRPADYIYNQSVIRSSIHDVSVMVIIPIGGMVTDITDLRRILDNDYPGPLILWGLIFLIIIAYFACTIHRKLFVPFLELTINLLLGAGIMINVYLIWSGAGDGLWIFLLGNGPIIILLGLMLARRYRLFVRRMPEMMDHVIPHGEVLDYLPDEDYVEPYYVERRGITALLLLELPLRLLFYPGIGGGLAGLLVMGGITLEGML